MSGCHPSALGRARFHSESFTAQYIRVRLNDTQEELWTYVKTGPVIAAG